MSFWRQESVRDCAWRKSPRDEAKKKREEVERTEEESRLVSSRLVRFGGKVSSR